MAYVFNDKSFNTQNVNRSTRRAKLGMAFILIGLIWVLVGALDIQNRSAWMDLDIKEGAIIFVPPLIVIAIGTIIRNKA